MTSLRPKVFVDFDGTITTQDVGNQFFRKFGNETESLKAVEMWKAGKMSGRDLTLKEAEYVAVDEEDALRYVETFQIDPTFKDFIAYCRSSSMEISVLSDGLDFYIKRIFDLNGISGVPFYSNIVRFNSNGIRVEFPYQSDCSKCGNCKGHQILTRTGIDDVVIYIGNGFSDRCAVQYADVIFAKDELLKYCEESNITYFPFETFEDVMRKMNKTFNDGKFRKRHRAELKRREAYLAE
ncbi:MAG TPA: MtnX-like HAD-IB family phosphatase [Candidatus Acidoferrales bacterium]|nr:MtnX-like HAD-IB family phosphatase [Candidatus Acidoferrales bacterium]